MSIFNTVKVKFKKKNKFNLSFASRLTTEFGRLTPILCEEVLPNDTFRLRSILRCQFAPMKFPVMQKFTAYIHYFFIPRRLLMTDWEEFITGGENGVEPDLHYPTIALSSDLLDAVDSDGGNYFGASSLFDYLGFPSIDNTDDVYLGDTLDDCHQIDPMPFKAYQLVYNEWYRDENLSTEIDIAQDVNGVVNRSVPDIDIIEWLKLRNRAWRKDYFTSALPDPQRGPDVTLPLIGGTEIVSKDDIAGNIYFSGNGSTITKIGGNGAANLRANSESNNIGILGYQDTNGFVAAGDQVKVNVQVSDTKQNVADTIAPTLEVNGDNSRSATINEVRRAFAIQRWYELAARCGNRYIESILAHFGIRSSDARLQRPEYIGGSVVAVNIGDVLQTSESGETPLGTPAGIAQALGACKKIKYTSEEHGYILGILSIIPEASYPQGLPRKFQRRDKFDFAWPLLANLGEQQIAKGELYFDFTKSPEINLAGFGYTPRYAEYKYGAGQVHGDFRTSLRDFHDARFFDDVPRLNQEFIEVSTVNDGDDGLNRIFAVQSSDMADHLWVSLFNEIKVRRVLPKYGTPI